MQFLAVTRRNLESFPAEAWTEAILEEEAQYVRTLYVEGFVRQIWRRKDEPGAVLLAEAQDVEEVRRKLAELPLAKRGMLGFVIVTELVPYSGFGPRT